MQFFSQNEEFYTKLQPLVTALNEEIPDAKYDAKQLAIMLVQILHFQEAALGKDVSYSGGCWMAAAVFAAENLVGNIRVLRVLLQAMPPRICPKLPIRLITDGSVNGALHAIAVKVHEIKRARALKAIEWQNPGKRKEVCSSTASASGAGHQTFLHLTYFQHNQQPGCNQSGCPMYVRADVI